MCLNVVISPVISGPIILSIISAKAQNPNPKSQAQTQVDSLQLGFGVWALGFGISSTMARVLDGARALSADQFLLTTLIVKLAVMAVLATMLVRYRRFRHILIFERRGWLDRLVFTLALGIPLMAGVTARLLLNYKAADLWLEGSFLAGLIAGPYAGALVGVLVGVPAGIAGEVIALPFAVGCGFAGGGLREACPKEAIWQFTPFVFIDLHKHVWGMLRKLGGGWPLWLLLPPAALQLLRQALGPRFGGARLFYPRADLGTPSPLITLGIVLAPLLAAPPPIKIWNSAQIAPETVDVVVPSMILQPLVENSIKHGLSRKIGSGTITLRSWRDQARLMIEVEDDGMGFLLERLEQPMTSGIGLANVRERLRVIYGATYQLTLASEPGKGTRARIEIPELTVAEQITA